MPMPRPIFIIASPRSGTSALTWALGQHPNISLQPETNWFPAIALSLREAYRAGAQRGKFSQLGNAGMEFEAFAAHFGTAIDNISRDCFQRRVRQFIPDYFERAEAPAAADSTAVKIIHAPSDPKLRFVDGTPEYSFTTYELRLLFPQCKFIHILRRPEDVVNSLAHFENAGTDGKNLDYASALAVWMKHTLASGMAAQAFGGGSVLRIRNQDLTTDPDAALRRCFEFAGEEHAPRAAAVLANKMNSSKAADRLQRTIAAISPLKEFARAKELFDELNRSQPDAAPDGKVLAGMRAAFDKAK